MPPSDHSVSAWEELCKADLACWLCLERLASDGECHSTADAQVRKALEDLELAQRVFFEAAVTSASPDHLKWYVQQVSHAQGLLYDFVERAFSFRPSLTPAKDWVITLLLEGRPSSGNVAPSAPAARPPWPPTFQYKEAATRGNLKGDMLRNETSGIRRAVDDLSLKLKVADAGPRTGQEGL